MSVDRGVTYGIQHGTFSFLLSAWTLGANKAVCYEVVDWSISQSLFGAEYSESESGKDPQTEQNSMQLSRQGKRKGM